MKKILSAFIALLLVAFSGVQVFATETDESITDTQYTEFLQYVWYCEYYYIKYEELIPMDFPQWSDATIQMLTEAIAYARERTITTKSELDEAYADMLDATAKMCVNKEELEFMIYLFEKETNINGYYDAKTWNNFQLLLEDAREAYESDDEKLVHHVYIDMRNTYDDICTYNTVYGDFNGDGILNVVDITYAQKYLVDSIDFNASQEYLTYIKGESVSGLSVTTVTYMQKYIVGLVTEFENPSLDELSAYEGLGYSTELDPILLEYPISISELYVNSLYCKEFDAYFRPYLPYV